MGYQTLLFEIKDAIATITINRPDKLNALNDQVVDELAHAAERIASEDAIKGAILTGAGSRARSSPAPARRRSSRGPISATSRNRGRSTARRARCAARRCCAASRHAASR